MEHPLARLPPYTHQDAHHTGPSQLCSAQNQPKLPFSFRAPRNPGLLCPLYVGLHHTKVSRSKVKTAITCPILSLS